MLWSLLRIFQKSFKNVKTGLLILTPKSFSKLFLERDLSSLLIEMIQWKRWSVKGIISTVIKIIDDDKNVNETYAALIRLKPLVFYILYASYNMNHMISEFDTAVDREKNDLCLFDIDSAEKWEFHDLQPDHFDQFFVRSPEAISDWWSYAGINQ